MTVLLETYRHDAVEVFELRNPPLNLLTLGLRSQLHEAALRTAADPDVRVVVVRSGQQKAFSAGSDVREFPATPAEGVARSAKEHSAFNAIARLPQPVIAELTGHVLGGGLELALACDIRVASEGTMFALPESGLGVFPVGGGTQRLPRLVGASRAKRLMFLGEAFEAADALEMGIVDLVVPAGSVGEATADLARRIADRPPEAIRAIKASVDRGLAAGFSEGEAMEEELATIFASADAREGVRAFLQGRSPRFGSPSSSVPDEASTKENSS